MAEVNTRVRSDEALQQAFGREARAEQSVVQETLNACTGLNGTGAIRHYSIRTEESYLRWIKQYIVFNNKRHPSELGEREVTEFLSYLANDK